MLSLSPSGTPRPTCSSRLDGLAAGSLSPCLVKKFGAGTAVVFVGSLAAALAAGEGDKDPDGTPTGDADISGRAAQRASAAGVQAS
jgi:hypothetical protein